jgi:hypothetical protein
MTPVDAAEVQRELAIGTEWIEEARSAWRVLLDALVWGQLSAPRLGALPKARKRALELGERLKSLASDRNWIPRPREQLKNALASYLNAGETLDELERLLGALDGGSDLLLARERCAAIKRLLADLRPTAERWAALLDREDGTENE